MVRSQTVHLIHFLPLLTPASLFFPPVDSHSPIKLTKRWRKNHEEEQLQQAETVSEPKRPNLLDLTFGSSSCASTTSIVNWLSQTSNMAGLAGSDYSPVSSELSLSDHSSLSPTSVSSSGTDDEPFNYLYLLATAAVDRLSSKHDQVNSNLELTIET